MTAIFRASNTKQNCPEYDLSSPHSTAQEISMYSDMVFFAAQRIDFIEGLQHYWVQLQKTNIEGYSQLALE